MVPRRQSTRRSKGFRANRPLPYRNASPSRMRGWPRQTGCDITENMSQDRPLNHDEMLAVLDWYRAAGVDIAVGEEPVDRLAQRPPARVTPPPVAAAAAQQAERPAEAPVLGGDPSEARELAASAQSLDEL